MRRSKAGKAKLGLLTVVAFTALLVLAAAMPAASLGALPDQLWQSPENGQEGGGPGAGQLDSPVGVAVDPDLGRKAHVFVAENNNFRISEFTTWGVFVRAWGWGVLNGAPELQTCANPNLPQAPDPADCRQGLRGNGAGQLNQAAGLALDAGGHVYVYDNGANRVEKFDTSAAQVKLERAWGDDVVSAGPHNSGANEQQKVVVKASSGKFALGLETAHFEARDSGGRTSAGSPLVTSTYTTAGFHVGDAIETVNNSDIPANTTIVAVNEAAHQLTLSANANLLRNDAFFSTRETSGASGIGDLTEGSVTVTNLVTANGAFAIGERISGPGIPAGTTIAGLGAGTLTLSNPVGAGKSGTKKALSAADIPAGASAAEVKAALEALPAVGAGAVGVARAEVGPEELEFVITFSGGALAGNDVPTLESSADNLDGAGKAVTVSTPVPGGGPEVCVPAAGDSCKRGSLGNANGQFAASTLGTYLAVGPAGTVFVGDKDRVQEFNPDGSFKAKVAVGGTVESLALDGAGNLYLAYAGGKEIEKLSPAGAPLAKFTIPGFNETKNQQGLIDDLGSIALDGAGDLYAVYDPKGAAQGGFALEGRNVEPEVLEFDPSGKTLIGPGAGFGQSPVRPPIEGIFIKGLATNPLGDLYAANIGDFSSAGYLAAFGPSPLAIEAPPPHPPEIKDQRAAAVETTSAQVRAKINPHFWPDATYRVEYGATDCAPGACPEQSEALALTTKSSGAFLNATALLGGLEPGATYHYRFVAQSSGGGPTRGAGEGPSGPSGTFATFPAPTAANTSCPNQAFRGGLSARLADCRAYEMVSPEEKNNADVFALGRTAFFQASGDGGRFSFPSTTSFAEPEGAPLISRYLSAREEGWRTESISPPRGLAVAAGVPVLADQFKAFSADLCTGWLWHDSDPLDPEAPVGYSNLYRLDFCGGEPPQALIHVKPPNRAEFGGEEFFPEFQGATPDGSAAIFRAEDDLDPELAIPDGGEGRPRLYEWSGGQLHFVCVRPSGAPVGPGLACSAGTANSQVRLGQVQSVERALSEDGSRVYWSSSGDAEGGPGKLYLRLINEAKSRPVSETVSATAGARFWTASADGAAALFTIEDGPLAGNLYAYDAEAGTSKLIAAKALGVLGASEDAGRFYFASREALSGGEENSEGDKAQAGNANLYLREGEATVFVATLSVADADNGKSSVLSPLNSDPSKRTSRLTPDGAHLAFMSTASLTGADNTDAASGEEDAQVFLYDANSKLLRCASCNRTGALPVGQRASGSLWAAAVLPAWRSQTYASHLLSDDGARLFFESTEALVLADTNGKRDAYEWEEAGHGDCEEGSAAYSPVAEGCISLISSGKSDAPSDLLDASADGSDVFFLTAQSLLPERDSGLNDVYDARVEGGFPPPPEPAPGCEGEACQSPPEAPNDPTPASSSFEGAGNVVEAGQAPKKPRCAKGKVRRHGKCVARKHHRRATHRRRVAR